MNPLQRPSDPHPAVEPPYTNTTRPRGPSHRCNATVEYKMPQPSLMEQREQIVKEFFQYINTNDLQGVRNLLTDDFVLVERNANKNKNNDEKIKSIMAVDETMASLQALVNAVPDLCMIHGSMEAEPSSKIVVVHDYRSVGTHNGTALDLFDMPIIEPSGMKFVLDPCDIYFTFDASHKISKLEEVEREETTGFSGVYNVLRHLDSIG